jgi:P4 family phage/plasmid primase-like protien
MIDLAQAQQFLQSLGSKMHGDRDFTFQTFDDNKSRREKVIAELEYDPLTRVIHGPLDGPGVDLKNDSAIVPHVGEELQRLNESGAGIFVTINFTDGNGRDTKNILGLRAVFIDDDQGRDLSVNGFGDDDVMGLAPNIIVKSAGGYHAYWLIDRWAPKDQFRPVQIALAKRFGTDPKIMDLPRVMRIPGFLHNKAEPKPVTLEHTRLDCLERGKGYPLEHVIAELGLTLPELKPKHEKRSKPVRGDIERDEKLRRCRGYLLNGIGPAVKGSGHGHADSLGACRAGNDFDLDWGEFYPLLMEWGSTCSPPWEPAALERMYWSVVNSDQGTKYPRGNKLNDPAHERRDRWRPNPADTVRDSDVPWSDSIGADESRDAHVELDGGVVGEPPPDDSFIWADSPNNPDKKGKKNKGKGGKSKKKGDGDGDGDGDGGGDGPGGGGGSGSGKKRKKRKRIGAPIKKLLGPQEPVHSTKDRDVTLATKRLLQEYEIFQDSSGQLYVYDGSMWLSVADEMIEKLAMQYFSYSDYKPSKAKDVVKIIKSRRHMKSIEWNSIGDTEIPLKSGVLNLETEEIRPHRPEDFLDRVIPYDYNPKAECPRWKRALDEWLPGKEQEQEAIQQFLGYVLMPLARYKRALFLYGGPDTGKSQVCNVARELVGGPRYVCGILPGQMSDPRARAPIKGMALNMVTDLPKGQMIDDGGFKQLVSTGEAVTLDQKHLRQETYMPTAKHIFATNNLPAINDATNAVFRRLLIISFEQEIPLGMQDPGLEDKLVGEMDGILAWAFEGAKRLHASRGVWPQVESSEKLINSSRTTGSIRIRCTISSKRAASS